MDLEDGNRLRILKTLNGVNGITDIIDRIGLTLIGKIPGYEIHVHRVNMFEFERHNLKEDPAQRLIHLCSPIR